METVFEDYSPRGVQFYYLYKPLAHPEIMNFVEPVTLEERLMHVEEAERIIGSGITWLADSMDDALYGAVGYIPNAEFVVGPDGAIVARRGWSDPAALRADLERLIGLVEHPTTVADLDLPEQRPIETVAKNVVPRVQMPEGSWPMYVEAIQETTDIPFYAKLRAEGTPELFATGKGMMYLGFHLDPIYRVHWNNEVDPLEFELIVPSGMTVTPARGVGPDPEVSADADPREFLLEVDAENVSETVQVRVQYFACDDALTFCIPVRQDYRVRLERDERHYWSVRTSAEGTYEFSPPEFLRRARRDGSDARDE